MSSCKMVDYDGGNIHKTVPDEVRHTYTWDHQAVLPENAIEGVLYMGDIADFVTRHNGKIMGLVVDRSEYWYTHTQIYNLIENEGLTPYDAFKVVCL